MSCCVPFVYLEAKKFEFKARKNDRSASQELEIPNMADSCMKSENSFRNKDVLKTFLSLHLSNSVPQFETTFSVTFSHFLKVWSLSTDTGKYFWVYKLQLDQSKDGSDVIPDQSSDFWGQF